MNSLNLYSNTFNKPINKNPTKYPLRNFSFVKKFPQIFHSPRILPTFSNSPKFGRKYANLATLPLVSGFWSSLKALGEPVCFVFEVVRKNVGDP